MGGETAASKPPSSSVFGAVHHLPVKQTPHKHWVAFDTRGGPKLFQANAAKYDAKR